MERFNEILTAAQWQQYSRFKLFFSWFYCATIDFITWSPKWYFCECTLSFGIKQNALHYCIDKGTFKFKDNAKYDENKCWKQEPRQIINRVLPIASRRRTCTDFVYHNAQIMTKISTYRESSVQ